MTELMTDPTLIPCSACRGRCTRRELTCKSCRGKGYTGIDPKMPCQFPPGHRIRVAWMRARRSARLPLWNKADKSLDTFIEAGATPDYRKNRAEDLTEGVVSNAEIFGG